MSNNINRIQALENEILARLITALTVQGQPQPKVDVQAWPNNPASFRSIHPLGTVLVIYKGTKYSKDTNTYDLAEFEISILARTLRGANPTDEVTQSLGVGMYDLIDTVLTSVHGWRPECSTGQYIVASDGFAAYNEGVWTYTLRCTVPMYPRIALEPVIGPWTDATCMSAPNLTEVNHVYELNQGEQ